MSNRLRISSAAIPHSIARLMRKDDRKAIGTGARTPEENQAAYETATERELQRLCEQEVSRRGWIYLHLRTKQQAQAFPGWPDLTVVAPDGITIYVELKAPSGKRSEDQKDLHHRMYALGHVTHVVRNFDHFRHVLDNSVNPDASRPQHTHL